MNKPATEQLHSRLRQQTPASLGEFYSGRKLWGDDFGLEEIREWYGLEENACFEIYDQGRRRMPNNDYLHWHHGYRWSMNERNTLGKVLGLGSGNGEEFRPVRRWIEHLYIVESAAGYFHNDSTTTYVKAQMDATLDFADDFFDTAVNIAVLHHIPNVSRVLRELYRVLKPGGICLVKEPITTLGDWREGHAVNLERAAKLGDELGGHIVSGHVDGLGRTVSVTPEGGSHRIDIEAPAPLHRYIAAKGSITVDGVSLTVNAVEGQVFGLNIIPHTWQATTLGGLKAGDAVNLEIDMLARYLARWQETA